MKIQLFLIGLIGIMLIAAIGSHIVIYPIQAFTQNTTLKTGNNQTNINPATSVQSLAHISTVKVKCFNLAAALVTISQAHADLTPEGKSHLDSVLAEEGVAPNYASEIHLFNEMVNQIKASCDKQSKDLVNGISF
jgi:hypothetical protein